MSKFMKSLCKIAIPVTLQSMLQASFSIVDQIMIGQLGETNISAVGLCGNFSLIFSVVIGAVSTVAGILIAQFIGAQETKEAWCRDLMGLSLKNVNVTIKNGKKVLFDEFGEMLFTHFGVSGPLILTASSKINTVLQEQDLQMFIDLKPALSEEQLQKRLIREFEENSQKQFKNALNGLFPARLIPIMISLSEINPEKKVCEISKAERQKFGNCIKTLPLTIVGTRDFKEAIITRGGVSVKDINPSTMESKIVKGLYFAGEMIDVDALTGGYNLQIAWSTGHLAGSSIE